MFRLTLALLFGANFGALQIYGITVRNTPLVTPADDKAVNLNNDGVSTLGCSTYADNCPIHVVYAQALNFTGLLSSMVTVSRALNVSKSCVFHLITNVTDIPIVNKMLECFRRETQTLTNATLSIEIHELQPVPFKGHTAQRHLDGLGVAFARMYIDTYLPNVSRAIYLDSDTVVRGDLGALYMQPMRHALAAVVQEDELSSIAHLYYPKDPGLKQQLEAIVGVDAASRERLFNDGVLLLDLQRWRRDNITKALESWQNKTTLVDDQAILNMEFLSRGIDKLDLTWNVFNLGCKSYRYPQEVMDTAQILHWSGGHKPWERWINGKGDWGRASYIEYWNPVKPRKTCEALNKIRVSKRWK